MQKALSHRTSSPLSSPQPSPSLPECDRIIRSNSQSSGIIKSPYYPEPSPRDILCHYDINGLVDRQNLEKVQLFIEDIDIGEDYVEEYVDTVVARGVAVGGAAASAAAGRNVARFNRSKCQNGALQAYTTRASQKSLAMYKIELQEQSTTKVSLPIPDYEFCGTSGNGRFGSYSITSDSPKMLLIYDTFGARSRRGFKVRYQFSTDYAIPGTAISGESPCHFQYMSTSAIQGTFNSPRHPSNYPDNTYCVYEFHGQPDEIVRLTFENFQVEDDANCSKDFVKIFKWLPPKLEEEGQQQQQVENLEFVPVGHYCGERFPGPQDEDSQIMRVTLNSDGHTVYKGFRARYEFVKRQPPDKKCFHSITNIGGGVINSPNYPHKYTTNKTCEWIVYGRSKANKILLTFDIFSIEGNPNEKKSFKSNQTKLSVEIGCGNAVLKIYSTSRSNMPAYELCGDNDTIDNLQIITKSNVLRLKFVSTAKATGGKGFRLPWTEILPMKGGRCPGFLCEKSGHCIPNDMKCNGVANCGKNDRSDELKNCETSTLNVVLCVLGVCFLLLILGGLLWLYCKRKKKKPEKDQKIPEVRIVTGVSEKRPRSANRKKRRKKRRMKEKTEMITIM
ncbi:hypothetical protein HELRODRAFT_161732 [Helobdella robusta]|uniref:CUB domain-containing protein n=1 Tax=Helobdella robusta TaxID=6412 RepID=T1ERU6_HELRO|nr:hypothetical protein HELRODRAFT_161732 [Helobdella robusta]ESO02461.1 hypothetical protein HELRODRAFT_161732 [Helobdella robusta]